MDYAIIVVGGKISVTPGEPVNATHSCKKRHCQQDWFLSLKTRFINKTFLLYW